MRFLSTLFNVVIYVLIAYGLYVWFTGDYSILRRIGSYYDEYISLKEKNDSLEKTVASLNLTINKLKTEVALLRSENASLKDTDQAYFNKAIDSFRTSKTISDFKKAEDLFDCLIEKFPNSPYANHVKDYKQKIQKEIDRLKPLENFEHEYNLFISKKDWGKALELLDKNKSILTDSDFRKRKEHIEFEKNRPIKTTINRLISDCATLANEDYQKFIYTFMSVKYQYRVELTGYIRSDIDVRRGRKTINIYNNIASYGTNIEVFYSSLDKKIIDYITDNNFGCDYKHAYKLNVIGTVRLYNNSDAPYIVAEKLEIEKIEYQR